MPRIARPVFAGVPHHVTQRGNRREDVFFSDVDRITYLAWFKEYGKKHEVDLLAYCLMTNHVHIVAVPNSEDGLERLFRPLHTRYAQHVNRTHGWKGHVWQGRFFSSALDDAYLWAAIRYVERNPVRARLVHRAEDYRWSSAAAYCGKRQDSILTVDRQWTKQLSSVDDWSTWFGHGDPPAQMECLRSRIERGLPCGSEEFISRLERLSGQFLRFRPRGRPGKDAKKK